MDLNGVLSMMANGAHALQGLAVAVATYIIGWYFIINGAWRLAKWGDRSRQYGVASVVVRTICGAALIMSAQTINMVAMTFTGYGADTSSMSVMGGGGGGDVISQVWNVALLWAAMFGVVAIIRGVMLFVKAADNPGGSHMDKDPAWTGLMFIVFGAVGVNLWRFASGLF